MIKKALIITALTALAIIAGFLWFAQSDKSAQDNQIAQIDNNLAAAITPEPPAQAVTTTEKVTENSNVEIGDNSVQNTNKNNSIDTSNWKTYTNEEYGFSVKYPEGWEVSTHMANGLSQGGIDCSRIPQPQECDTFTLSFFSSHDNASAFIKLLAVDKYGENIKKLRNQNDYGTENHSTSFITYKYITYFNELLGRCERIAILDNNGRPFEVVIGILSSFDDIPANERILDKNWCAEVIKSAKIHGIIDTFHIISLK